MFHAKYLVYKLIAHDLLITVHVTWLVQSRTPISYLFLFFLVWDSALRAAGRATPGPIVTRTLLSVFYLGTYFNQRTQGSSLFRYTS